jgi:hypothetical protein
MLETTENRSETRYSGIVSIAWSLIAHKCFDKKRYDKLIIAMKTQYITFIKEHSQNHLSKHFAFLRTSENRDHLRQIVQRQLRSITTSYCWHFNGIESMHVFFLLFLNICICVGDPILKKGRVVMSLTRLTPPQRCA